jgi:hypothetical protein
VLDRDPNRRFGSATELSEALAYAAGLSVKRPTPAYGPPMSNLPQSPMQGVGTGTALANMSPAPYGNMTPSPYMQPQYPMNVTSPPFVASASPHNGGSKGLFVFAFLAGIVGLALAGWGAKRIIDARAETSSTSVATTTAQHVDTPPTAIVTPLTTVATMTTQQTATATATTPTTRPTAPNGHPTAHPTATNPATVTYTAAPPPTVTAHPTATATATQRPGDFGAGF